MTENYAIARIYVSLIKKGLKTLDDIKDEEMRAKVEDMMKSEDSVSSAESNN